jgi:hypothetical protein
MVFVYALRGGDRAVCVYEMVLEVMQVPLWSSVEMPNSCFPIRGFSDDVRRGPGARARAWYSVLVFFNLVLSFQNL